MITRVTTKYINDQRKVDAAYKRGLAKCLDRSGTITRRSAQRQFSRRKPKKRPTFTPAGDLDGVPVMAASFRPPIPGKVTSWRTSRNVRGYLRSAIYYAKDMRGQTVVIGPSATAVTVNQLQEFGGSAMRQLRLVAPRPLTEFAGVRFQQAQYVGMWSNVNSRKKGQVARRATAKVPAGRFMGKGLDAILKDLPQQFRGLVQGP
jgi:hypothetical protein